PVETVGVTGSRARQPATDGETADDPDHEPDVRAPIPDQPQTDPEGQRQNGGGEPAGGDTEQDRAEAEGSEHCLIIASWDRSEDPVWVGVKSTFPHSIRHSLTQGDVPKRREARRRPQRRRSWSSTSTWPSCWGQ